jgi:hypothetical protein
MKPFYEARVEDLTLADRVRVECQCRRVALISVAGLGVPGYTPVKELARRLRRDNCGERGKVDLTMVWHEG